MFTGLIECVGRLTGMRRSSGAVRLELTAPLPSGEVTVGDSIAVNGACLTVTSASDSHFSFDISPETVDRTTFRALEPGNRLNIERALRLGARLDGHLVTGHVDCTGRLERSESRGNARILTFSLPAQHGRLLVDKGSVAIDGISLTVNSVEDERFSVAIIPHTLENTTLAFLVPGQAVNIETDIIGKYIARLVSSRQPDKGLTMETLVRNGFV
ncbi:riboflavin synthase [Trichlorobacter ammonificans]|uniref:Riboflavin synthase n=1 Tax=Trichlorobacter ammonificans TaxID=2916410 RepID=A0ABM9D7P3_9BACT|nr:riboflavin synthase [Trichlorobacter ammonificans]CAH2031245.1 Riboflavin synthase [Trichlorobacter ammonificans]